MMLAASDEADSITFTMKLRGARASHSSMRSNRQSLIRLAGTADHQFVLSDYR
jgi:hypothetical protein